MKLKKKVPVIDQGNSLGFWGGINVAMNPFFDDRRFISSLNAIYTFDSQVINPTAFCKMTKA